MIRVSLAAASGWVFSSHCLVRALSYLAFHLIGGRPIPTPSNKIFTACFGAAFREGGWIVPGNVSHRKCLLFPPKLPDAFLPSLSHFPNPSSKPVPAPKKCDWRKEAVRQWYDCGLGGAGGHFASGRSCLLWLHGPACGHCMGNGGLAARQAQRKQQVVLDTCSSNWLLAVCDIGKLEFDSACCSGSWAKAETVRHSLRRDGCRNGFSFDGRSGAAAAS